MTPPSMQLSSCWVAGQEQGQLLCKDPLELGGCGLEGRDGRPGLEVTRLTAMGVGGQDGAQWLGGCTQMGS